jgi:ABC-type phosphate/phosphonate transport system substrate-binding protein
MTRRRFAQLLALIAAGTAVPGLNRAQGQERRMRVGVSADTLAGANINDARAAYRAWGRELQRSLGITHTDLVPDVFIPSEQIMEMIRAGTIDCFALTAWEYAKVVDLLDTDWVLIDDYVEDGLDYILAVHNDSAFKKIEDLQRRELIVHHHRDTVLLSPWLSLLLASSGQAPPEQFFAKVLPKDNLIEVVLPVFFQRADAAGLTRRAFLVAAEMNPQLGRDLRVLAVSPKVIPMAFCFRRGCNPEDVKEFKDAIVRMRSVPAGQQLLEMYQVKGYTARQGSYMKTTIEMVRQYERLQARVGAPSKRAHS